jgi:hypothetical protein
MTWLLNCNLADFGKGYPLLPYDREKRLLKYVFGKS